MLGDHDGMGNSDERVYEGASMKMGKAPAYVMQNQQNCLRVQQRFAFLLELVAHHIRKRQHIR
jgi:hypothetical protein